MKKQTNPVTVEILDDRLKKTEDKFDKKLDLRLKQTEDKFDKKLDLRLKQTEDKFDKKLEQFSQEVVQEISDLFYDKFERIDERFADTDKKLDRILNVLDGVSKNVQDARDENAASTLLFERNKEKLDDHEKRLKKLETSRN